MTRREKTRDLFIELINEQLKPHGVTYEDWGQGKRQKQVEFANNMLAGATIGMVTLLVVTIIWNIVKFGFA